MQKFKYTAVNLQKEKYSGVFIAEDEKDLAIQLQKQNLFLVSCSPYKGGTPSAFFTLGTGKVSMNELTTFCRQFAIMINAGMSILTSLDVLRKQTFSQYFSSILDVVYEDVKSGMMFSEALNKHDKVFPNFFRSMVYVGEAGGKMEMVFNSLADYYENDGKVKKKAKSAMAYPIMLICMTIAIAILMLVYIVPTFKESLSALDVEPEGITKVCYDMSDFVLANWRVFVLSIVVIVGLAVLYGTTAKGKQNYDWLKVNLPLIKNIQIDMLTARFARGFGLLLSSGMDVMEALEAVTVVIDNKDVEKRFEMAKAEIRVGTSISSAFEKYKLFPNMLIQMVSVGEKTATLDEVLMRTCDFFDEQAERTITNVTNTLQPIILAVMGGVVAIMFIAVYSPMISIMEGITVTGY